MKKPKYEPDDGTLLDEDLAAIRESAATMLPSGKVISQRKHKLADLLAELPDGFEITDDMRAWMNMPEVGKEVWWRDGCVAGYLELAAKLRSYIPDGDGYDSDYAKTLASAADALESVLLRPIRSAEEYDLTVSLMNYLLGTVGDQEDHALSWFLDLVSDLVAGYDANHFAIEASETKVMHITPVGGNVFADLGFAPEDAAALQADSKRIISEKKRMRKKK